MNWKLIVQLSMFGLAMGIGTVFVIPSNVEPLFWIVALGITAYLLASRAPGRLFQHGLLVGIVNSVWVTGAHFLFFRHYIATHPKEAAMMASMPMPAHPRLMMLMVGAAIGVISGAVIGLFTYVAARFVRSSPPDHVLTH